MQDPDTNSSTKFFKLHFHDGELPEVLQMHSLYLAHPFCFTLATSSEAKVTLMPHKTLRKSSSKN
ncbi:hypothetical protein E2C01_096759 [Portunus trituberculatus]|uniref:Uncharacterized protein n=1 Tax=Portunus trituberculatus TaxID=210409 RepID=A0A5B7K2L5_PORTR|nr:hypothetical protein [Portunus trituberculatus]